jgi:hypothetical protein
MNTATTTVIEKCVFPMTLPRRRVQTTSYMRPVDPDRKKQRKASVRRDIRGPAIIEFRRGANQRI